MRSLRRIMTGALPGRLTALSPFTLLDSVLITGPAVGRGEAPETNLWSILAISGAGSVLGGTLAPAQEGWCG